MQSGIIKTILEKIEKVLESGIFTSVETEYIELKDLSTGNDWKSLKQTICAFLNTNGGIIITGIRERNGQYILTGYNSNNESRFNALCKAFTDDRENEEDLSQYLGFEIKSISNKQVYIIRVLTVSDDRKYIFFDGEAYERKTTSDQKIPKKRIDEHREYKQTELIYAKEIKPVSGAGITDLDVDKLNEYIQLLNRDIKVQNLKSDIQHAIPFLNEKHFINKNEEVTTCSYAAIRLSSCCIALRPAI